ncbi:MAG: pilus assembly protein PilM [bacterium]
MPAAKKILVLDLGMQSLRIAEFSKEVDGGLKLQRGAKRELILDPSLETTRPDQIRQALGEIVKEWKPKHHQVALVLPAHTVFTKVAPLEVPGGDASQVAALIGFEAQHNIPFPLEEVVWDYLVMGQTPSGAVNVVYIAVKADLLEDICKSISLTGLQITSISASPLALYDAFRHAYPAETLSSTSLLLDIGSRTSNMVVTSPGSFFSRSIPSGGLSVTTAIAKDIHVELEEAELLKISRGMVALGAGVAPPEDPVEANLARITRQTLLKTQADISRSLSYYRSTLSGSAPDLVLVTGGMASMPYLAEFLTEKLLKETSFFEPLRGISVSEEALPFVESNSNNLGELVGGALSITDIPHTKVSLLPASLSSKRELEKRLPWLIAAAMVFLFALAAWYAFALHATTATQDETAKINAAIQEEKSFASKIDSGRTQLDSLNQVALQLLSIIQLRDAYPAILSELSAKVPERYLWITEIQPIAPPPVKGSSKSNDPANKAISAISVKGLYLDNHRQAAVIDDFVTALQSSGIFVVEEKEKSKVITQRSSPSGQYWAYPFALTIPLRNPIPPLP